VSTPVPTLAALPSTFSSQRPATSFASTTRFLRPSRLTSPSVFQR
jgi:hypothetical protein